MLLVSREAARRAAAVPCSDWRTAAVRARSGHADLAATAIHAQLGSLAARQVVEAKDAL
jgi:hypothetical protein